MTSNNNKKDLLQIARNNTLSHSTSNGVFCVGSSGKAFCLFRDVPSSNSPPPSPLKLPA